MRVLILGAGVSGTAAARLARRLGWSPVVFDEQPESLTALLSEGVATVAGTWDRHLLGDVDLVVTSPGIPERSVPIVDTLESGVPLWSEIELAWRQLDVPTVAVTGTNGKTTVTSLIADMLVESGSRAAPLGNIGTPLSNAVGRSLDVAVVEVSSFQLRFTETFRPDIAVVTNVAPDHLDWHGSFDRYLDAKRQIVVRQRPEDVVVYDVDDDGARRVAESAPSERLAVSGTRLCEAGFGVSGGRLMLGDQQIPISDLRVHAPAYLFDLAAAGASAVLAGADAASVATVARRFRPGPHRRTVVGTMEGVTFVDDSKATNPHAALASIAGYDRVVLIAGGLAKGLDLTPLAQHPKVRTLVAIGAAAPDLLRVAGARGVGATTMDDAVRKASEAAEPGDVVLLAPGCASFDMFEDYARRGDVFSEAVHRLVVESRNQRSNSGGGSR